MNNHLDRSTFVYVTHINTTPERLWEALTTTDFIPRYWFGRRQRVGMEDDSAIESRSPESELKWRRKSEDWSAILKRTVAVINAWLCVRSQSGACASSPMSS
jgi:uncharacterized protein YndB with AHSA1/START domain